MLFKNMLQSAYAFHVRDNVQHAVAISFKRATFAMVIFNFIRNAIPWNRFYILQHFIAIISSNTRLMKGF